MRKITTILVACMALFMFVAAVQPALALDALHGYATNSYDEEGVLMDADMTVIVDNEDVSKSVNAREDQAGFQDMGTYGAFAYPAAGDREWSDDPELGDEAYFISEANDGYFWAAMRVIEHLDWTPEDQTELIPQYELIETPYVADEENDIGTDFITITVESPSYTDFSHDDGAPVMGTFDLFESYAVFIQGGDYADWTYLGNTEEVAGDYQDPIIPDVTNPQAVDPDTITTGLNTFTVEDLDPDTEYNFMVRVNLDFGDIEDGYEGGLGSYTTFGSGPVTPDPITTDPEDVPEFGPGMMVPVVAIVGMFVAFTVYRRKKEE